MRLKYLLYAPAGVIGVVGAMSYYEFHYPPPPQEVNEGAKRLVILGTGWGAAAVIRHLWSKEYKVTVISPRNYFLFSPLLPSVTTGALESRSILTPIRYMLRKKPFGVEFLEAECTQIHPEKQTVTIMDNSEVKGAVQEKSIPYDYLVIGVGAENATFNIPGVKEHGLFLKDVQDAKKIRSKIQDCLETAQLQDNQEERQQLLSAVVVGGGPTGVEFAGEMHDFLREDIYKWFPGTQNFKITLIEALPRVLPSFSKALVDYTERTFKDSRIDILNNTLVQEVTEKEVIALDKNTNEKISIPFGLLIWATGNTSRPLIRQLMDKVKEQSSKRGLLVDDFLQVKGLKNVYALGDCTYTENPPTAQVAYQQGQYLSKLFNEMGDALTEGKAYQAKPFQYRHLGALAYIGADKAVGDFKFSFGDYSLDGILANVVWNSVYFTTLFSVRNQVLVGFDWMKHRLFGRDISRE